MRPRRATGPDCVARGRQPRLCTQFTVPATFHAALELWPEDDPDYPRLLLERASPRLVAGGGSRSCGRPPIGSGPPAAVKAAAEAEANLGDVFASAVDSRRRWRTTSGRSHSSPTPETRHRMDPGSRVACGPACGPARPLDEHATSRSQRARHRRGGSHGPHHLRPRSGRSRRPVCGSRRSTTPRARATRELASRRACLPKPRLDSQHRRRSRPRRAIHREGSSWRAVSGAASMLARCRVCARRLHRG